MTSSPDPTPDVSRVRDAPLDRRTTSSSTQRYSIGSSEAGESSAAAGKRNSDATLNDDTLAASIAKDGKRSHRSHRSRNSVRSRNQLSSFIFPSEELTLDVLSHGM